MILKQKLKVNRNLINYLILNSKTNFFQLAEEFTNLQSQFLKESFYETLNLWIDMVVYPIISILMCFIQNEPPSLMTMLSMQKTATSWADWFRYKELLQEVKQWTAITRELGGPYISCNDPTYHIFVYADAMERLRTSTLSSLRSSTHS